LGAWNTHWRMVGSGAGPHVERPRPQWRVVGMKASRAVVLALLAAWSLAEGEVVTRRWRPPAKDARVEVLPGKERKILKLDLSSLPVGARVYRADLVLPRSGPVLGNEEDAMVKVEVYPVFAAAGQEAKPTGKPLALRGPWFDRLDATEAARAACRVDDIGSLFFGRKDSRCLGRRVPCQGMSEVGARVHISGSGLRGPGRESPARRQGPQGAPPGRAGLHHLAGD